MALAESLRQNLVNLFAKSEDDGEIVHKLRTIIGGFGQLLQLLQAHPANSEYMPFSLQELAFATLSFDVLLCSLILSCITTNQDIVPTVLQSKSLRLNKSLQKLGIQENELIQLTCKAMEMNERHTLLSELLSLMSDILQHPECDLRLTNKVAAEIYAGFFVLQRHQSLLLHKPPSNTDSTSDNVVPSHGSDDTNTGAYLITFDVTGRLNALLSKLPKATTARALITVASGRLYHSLPGAEYGSDFEKSHPQWLRILAANYISRFSVQDGGVESIMLALFSDVEPENQVTMDKVTEHIASTLAQPANDTLNVEEYYISLGKQLIELTQISGKGTLPFVAAASLTLSTILTNIVDKQMEFSSFDKDYMNRMYWDSLTHGDAKSVEETISPNALSVRLVQPLEGIGKECDDTDTDLSKPRLPTLLQEYAATQLSPAEAAWRGVVLPLLSPLLRYYHPDPDAVARISRGSVLSQRTVEVSNGSELINSIETLHKIIVEYPKGPLPPKVAIHLSLLLQPLLDLYTLYHGRKVTAGITSSILNLICALLTSISLCEELLPTSLTTEFHEPLVASAVFLQLSQLKSTARFHLFNTSFLPLHFTHSQEGMIRSLTIGNVEIPSRYPRVSVTVTDDFQPVFRLHATPVTLRGRPTAFESLPATANSANEGKGVRSYGGILGVPEDTLSASKIEVPSISLSASQGKRGAKSAVDLPGRKENSAELFERDPLEHAKDLSGGYAAAEESAGRANALVDVMALVLKKRGGGKFNRHKSNWIISRLFSLLLTRFCELKLKSIILENFSKLHSPGSDIAETNKVSEKSDLSVAELQLLVTMTERLGGVLLQNDESTIQVVRSILLFVLTTLGIPIPSPEDSGLSTQGNLNAVRIHEQFASVTDSMEEFMDQVMNLKPKQLIEVVGEPENEPEIEDVTVSKGASRVLTRPSLLETKTEEELEEAMELVSTCLGLVTVLLTTQEASTHDSVADADGALSALPGTTYTIRDWLRSFLPLLAAAQTLPDSNIAEVAMTLRATILVLPDDYKSGKPNHPATASAKPNEAPVVASVRHAFTGVTKPVQPIEKTEEDMRQALSLVLDPEPAIQAGGFRQISRLFLSYPDAFALRREPGDGGNNSNTLDSHTHSKLTPMGQSVLQICLQQVESTTDPYVLAASSHALQTIAYTFPVATMPVLLQLLHDESKPLRPRVKIGEVLVYAIRNAGKSGILSVFIPALRGVLFQTGITRWREQDAITDLVILFSAGFQDHSLKEKIMQEERYSSLYRAPDDFDAYNLALRLTDVADLRASAITSLGELAKYLGSSFTNYAESFIEGLSGILSMEKVVNFSRIYDLIRSRKEEIGLVDKLKESDGHKLAMQCLAQVRRSAALSLKLLIEGRASSKSDFVESFGDDGTILRDLYRLLQQISADDQDKIVRAHALTAIGVIDQEMQDNIKSIVREPRATSKVTFQKNVSEVKFS